MSLNGQRFNVGGILLDRPFKIRRLGHFGFNIEKLEEARHFYGDLLGFAISDKADFSRAPWFPKDAGLGDCHGYFMRYGTDHHAMVLFSKPVMDQRADRKFVPEVTINQITWQCGSLREIVEAYGYFQEQQVRIQRVGRDMDRKQPRGIGAQAEKGGLAEGDDAGITQREIDREGEEDHLERGGAEADVSVGDKECAKRDRPRKDMPGPAQAAIAAAKLRERRSWIVDRRLHGADRAGTKPCGRHSSKTMTNT